MEELFGTHKRISSRWTRPISTHLKEDGAIRKHPEDRLMSVTTAGGTRRTLPQSFNGGVAFPHNGVYYLHRLLRMVDVIVSPSALPPHSSHLDD